MRSESVSGFFHSLANFPTPHMSGSWLPCLILSQNPHSLPKLISNKYTDVLTNPLHAPMMRAHVMWTFLIWAGWPIFHFSVLEEFTVSVSTCIRAGNVDQQLQVCKISCLSFCTSFLFYHSNAVCLQDVAMLQVFFFFFLSKQILNSQNKRWKCDFKSRWCPTVVVRESQSWSEPLEITSVLYPL